LYALTAFAIGVRILIMLLLHVLQMDTEFLATLFPAAPANFSTNDQKELRKISTKFLK
jgi:hypothetical protein